jgi:hypothetical protein
MNGTSGTTDAETSKLVQARIAVDETWAELQAAEAVVAEAQPGWDRAEKAIRSQPEWEALKKANHEVDQRIRELMHGPQWEPFMNAKKGWNGLVKRKGAQELMHGPRWDAVKQAKSELRETERNLMLTPEWLAFKASKSEAEGRLAAAQRAFRKADSKWTQTAESLTPDEWRDAVDRIRGLKLRIQVANIVWWDYFGNRITTKSWPHLDGYREAWFKNRGADPSDVMGALWALGYPKRLVERRCKIESYEPVETEEPTLAEALAS